MSACVFRDQGRRRSTDHLRSAVRLTATAADLPLLITLGLAVFRNLLKLKRDAGDLRNVKRKILHFQRFYLQQQQQLAYVDVLDNEVDNVGTSLQWTMRPTSYDDAMSQPIVMPPVESG